MLGYAIMFAIIALIAGGLGFGLIGGMSYGIAENLLLHLSGPGRAEHVQRPQCPRVSSPSADWYNRKTSNSTRNGWRHRCRSKI